MAAGYRSAAFVVSSGKITVKGAGNDSAKLKLYLADPEMLFQGGDPIRVRVLEGGNVLVDKDLADLTANEAHVMVEVTIGQKSYYTSVTVFEPRDNKYTTKMPNR